MRRAVELLRSRPRRPAGGVLAWLDALEGSDLFSDEESAVAET